jgi:hypothetical protein
MQNTNGLAEQGLKLWKRNNEVGFTKPWSSLHWRLALPTSTKWQVLDALLGQDWTRQLIRRYDAIPNDTSTIDCHVSSSEHIYMAWRTKCYSLVFFDDACEERMSYQAGYSTHSYSGTSSHAKMASLFRIDHKFSVVILSSKEVVWYWGSHWHSNEERGEVQLRITQPDAS